MDHHIRESEIAEEEVNKLAAGAGFSVSGKVGGRLMAAFVDLIAARFLGPAVFGLYAIGSGILQNAGVIASLGLDKGVVRLGTAHFKSSPSRFKGVLLQSIFLAFLSGAVLGLLLFIVAPLISVRLFRKPELVTILQLFALGFPLYSGMMVAAAATLIYRVRYTVFIQDIVQPAINFGLILVVVWLGWSLSGVIAAELISVGVAFGLGLYYVLKLYRPVFSQAIVPVFPTYELLSFSTITLIAGVFSQLNLWANRLAVSAFEPAASVGIYQAASQIPMLFSFVQGAFTTVAMPLITDLYQRAELGKMRHLYAVATKWSLYVSLPALLLVVLLPHDMMTVIFGVSYGEGWLPLVIICAGQLVNSATGPVGVLLQMSGNQRFWLIDSVLSFGANLIGCVLLIPRFGLIGAAMSYSLALSILYVFGIIQARRKLGAWPYDARYIKGLIAAIASALVLILVRALSLDMSMRLLLAAFTSIAIFLLVLLFLGLDEEDKSFISLVKKQFRRLIS